MVLGEQIMQFMIIITYYISNSIFTPIDKSVIISIMIIAYFL